MLPAKAPTKAPPAVKAWLPSTRLAWREYWKQQVAGLVTPAHLPALKHLFGLRDRRERAGGLLTLGFEREIGRLEKQFGMTPEAQTRMEAAAPPAERPSLEDLVALVEQASGAERPDLRLRLVG